MSKPGSAQPVEAIRETLLGAVVRALRAPSVHNTQPWRWRVGDGVIELYADRTRKLSSTDPDGRDLVMSCGAALHHLRVALADLRVASTTERIPDPENDTLMASVHVAKGVPDQQDAALAPAIEQRRTDRRAMAAPPSPEQIRQLAWYAERQGATLHAVSGHVEQARLLAILDDAQDRQRQLPGYAAELATWTHRYHGGHDGIAAENRTTQATAYTLRAFPAGSLAAAPLPRTAFEDGSTLVVVATEYDHVEDWLRAGEATSAVLLAATRLGLGTTPLSQPTEIEHTRNRLATAALGIGGSPQLLIRIGHLPTNASELPATPRRPLTSVMADLAHP